MKKILVIFCFIAVTFQFSCTGQYTMGIRQDYNFNGIKSVGITEFTPSGSVSSSGKIVQDAFVRYLLSKGVDVKIVNTKTGDELTNARLAGVTVLITGSVIEFQPDRKYLVYLGEDNSPNTQKVVHVSSQLTEIPGSNIYGRGPAFGVEGKSEILVSNATVGVSANMIDTQTGSVIWSNNYVYEGLDLQGTLDGLVRYLMRTLKSFWPSVA
ncbi:MAG: hypothetical protein WC955_03180 [Elusimicrobiota bacterium]